MIPDPKTVARETLEHFNPPDLTIRLTAALIRFGQAVREECAQRAISLLNRARTTVTPETAAKAIRALRIPGESEAK